MKTGYKAIWIVLLIISAAVFPSTALAQYCGMPEETTTITTSDGTELQIGHMEEMGWTSSWNSITVVGDGYCLYIHWSPDWLEGLSVGINNSDSSFSYGEGIISLEHSFNYIQNNETEFDSSAWPPEYRELWDKAEWVCGELLQTKDLWDMLDELDDETVAQIREYLALMSEGVCDAFSYSAGDEFVIQTSVSTMWPDGRLARGYSIRGCGDLKIETPSPYGDENPEIFIDAHGWGAEISWTVHIDPFEQLCTISFRSDETAVPATMEYWQPHLDELHSHLEVYHRLMPSLIEQGIFESDSEFALLVEKSLSALTSFRIEIEEPPSDDTM
jgi:hypothetical protein